MLLGYIFFFLSDYCVISSVYLGISQSLNPHTGWTRTVVLMLYCFVLSAINHKYISSSQLKTQTRNLWWRFILISSICTWSIMTTPRSLDKKKITQWPSTGPRTGNYLPMLTSIAVDILGSERSCMKTVVTGTSWCHSCNVVVMVVSQWSPGYWHLLDPGGGREWDRRGPHQHDTLLSDPPDLHLQTMLAPLMLTFRGFGVQFAPDICFIISWRRKSNILTYLARTTFSPSHNRDVTLLQPVTADIVNWLSSDIYF